MNRNMGAGLFAVPFVTGPHNVVEGGGELAIRQGNRKCLQVVRQLNR
jgi:hypothetical protein